MNRRYVLGIDSGTSVVKALLTDLEGHEVGLAAESTPVETPHPGWSEFDLMQDWASVGRAIRSLLALTGIRPEEILAVGVTGKGWGCCYLQADGSPARKGILWNDARAADYLERWERDGTLGRAYEISGNYYYSGDCAPITRWVVDHEPEVAARTRWAIFPGAAIVYRLTGQIKLGFGDPPSVMDIRRRDYSEEIFERLGISEMRSKFPELTSSTAVAGQVTREAATATGLLEGTPVVLAESDVSSTATGLGVTQDGQVGIILGTAHVISVCQSELVLAPATGALTVLLPYADGKYLKLTGPSIATPNLDWFLENLGEPDRRAAEAAKIPFYEYLDDRLKSIPCGADGVLFHPYLSPGGERAPFRKPSARANFFGLDLHHTRHHMLRSIYEGVALSALDCVTATGVELKELSLAGGGANSPVWCQIEADIMGCPVRVPAGREHGARGALITTLLAMGVHPNYEHAIARLVHAERSYQPDMRSHEKYREQFELFRSIRTHLMDDWDRRAAIAALSAPAHGGSKGVAHG